MKIEKNDLIKFKVLGVVRNEECEKWEKWLDQIKDISFQKEEWENCKKCLDQV